MADPKISQEAPTTTPLRKRGNESATRWQETGDVPETYSRALFMADLEIASRRVTEEVNSDPEAAERLRKARQEARAGKTKPWRRSDDST